MSRAEEYESYHRAVVDWCVSVMGEECREFYDEKCTWFPEFDQGVDPRQVAQDQLVAMRELVAEADARGVKPVPPRRRFRAI
jgi:hypothetical protein